MEPENLLDNDSRKPKAVVQTLLIGAFLYVVAVVVLFFAVYMGCINLIVFENKYLSSLWLIFLATIPFLIPGYFLQEKAFQLLNKSIVKSASIPIAIWTVLAIIILIIDFNIKNIEFFLGSFLWFVPLCFIISWFISNRQTGLFVLFLIVHLLGGTGLHLLSLYFNS